MSSTFASDAPECPYCERKQSHDGGYFYNEDLTEAVCDHCWKVFEIEVSHLTYWRCTKIEDQEQSQ